MDNSAPLHPAPVLTASDFIPEELTVYEPQAPRQAGNQSGHYWNDVIIDRMLVDPAITVVMLATELKKTEAWVGTIRRSDSFKLRYQQRRREFESNLKEALTDKLIKVANKSLDAIAERLEKSTVAIKMETLVDVADKALERLGYGVKQAPTAAVQINMNQVVSPVSADELAEARKLMREHQAGKSRPITIEAEINDPLLLEYGDDRVEATASVVGVEAEFAEEKAA